jgi:5-methylcytosine-specific restriction endonuclease McrA
MTDKDWTESRLWGAIRGGLRSAHRFYPPKLRALKRKVRERRVKKKDGTYSRWLKGVNKGKIRTRKEYQCAKCKKWFVQGKIQVDHIVACGSLRSMDDLPGFIERLFTTEDGYQVLCKPCHRVKTAEEREGRKK